jgi:hypothetical protein
MDNLAGMGYNGQAIQAGKPMIATKIGAGF